MAIFDCAVRLSDGGGENKFLSTKIINPYLNIEIYGLDTDAIIQELLNNSQEITSQEMSNHLGALAAYGQIDELNIQLEEAGIDLVEMYGGEDSDAGNLIKTILETANNESDEYFDANSLAGELYTAMKGIGTNEDVLIEILGNASYTPEQIQEICEIYEAKYKHTLHNDIDSDTSGKFNTLLLARLSAVNTYINNTIRDDINFNRDNSNNIQSKEAETEVISSTAWGDSWGSVETTTYKNSNGQPIGEIKIDYDYQGNVLSKTTSQYIYDENGNLREQIDIKTNTDGEETMTVVHRMDKNGNIVQEYMSYVNENGTNQERNIEYLYNDKNNPSLCTKMREHDTLYSKDGEVIYKGEKESESFMLALRNECNEHCIGDGDYKRVAQCTTAQKLIDFLNNEGNEITLDEFSQNWQLEFDVKDFTVIELSDKSVELIGEEILAKIDLIANDDSALVAILNAFDINDLYPDASDGDFVELIKDRFKKALQEAAEKKDFKKLTNLYNELNEKLYPEGSQNDMLSSIVSMHNAENYYNSLNSDEVKEQMSIRDDYNPTTMKPQTCGEMLLYQLQEVKDQYALHKDNMGFLDSSISFMNRAFDVGTSEDDLNEIFRQYETRLRNLSNLEGNEFCAMFKALTGDEFSQDTMNEIKAVAEICSRYDNMSEEELLSEARGWAKVDPDIKAAYADDEIENLRTLLKRNYIEAINGIDELNKAPLDTVAGASNSTPGAALDDYKDTVVAQRKFAIELARTALTTLLIPSGAGWVAASCIGALIGGATEALASVLNQDAEGSQETSFEETIANVISGALSSAFQGGGGAIARDIMKSTCLAKYQAKYPGVEFLDKNGNFSKQIKINGEWVINPLYKITDALEKIAVKGAAGEIIKDDTKLILSTWIAAKDKPIEEQEKLWNECWSNLGDTTYKALEEGLLIGLLLFGVDMSTSYIGKLGKIAHDDNLAKGGADGIINTPQERLAAFFSDNSIKSLLNTAARTTGAIIVDGEFDPEKMSQTTWKEFAKSYLKK